MSNVLPVSNVNNDVLVEEPLKPDACCFVTKNCCSRRTVLYNLFKLIEYIFSAIIVSLMILSIVLECYIYENTEYTRDQQLAVFIISILFIEIVILPMIIISCCINKTIWPVIILNIVYIIVQMLLIFSILTNTEY